MVTPTNVGIPARIWLFLPLAVVGVLGVGDSSPGFAAETAEPSTMTTTSIVLKLDSKASVDIRSTFQESPPTLTLEFPKQKVVGSLPERSSIQEGPLQAITTQYEITPGLQSQRFIHSLQMLLRGSYAYRIRSEPGRIIVEFDHPASVGSRTMEVGLKRGQIIGGVGQSRVTERFLVMENALKEAASGRPASPISPWPSGTSTGVAATLSTDASVATPASPTPVPSRQGRVQPSQAGRPGRLRSPMGFGVFLFVIAACVAWVVSQRETLRGFLTRAAPSTETRVRLPSGVALIDELVWQAFERQGYQLVNAVELAHPSGTLRVIAKEGMKAALLFVWNGLFFEKRTVEQFVSAMRQVNIELGFLVASGSFTVPAQRTAKEHHVTLIGRDQLMELLSAGAMSEYFTKQLEQAQTRLGEAKETLRQYANQLDTLRRQRNEASWYLGEERANTERSETQLAELSQQLRHHEMEIERWQQEADALRKGWDESQWYLGESRARVQYLESQLTALQEVAKRVEPAERARDEANWYLGEERVKRHAFEERHAQLESALKESVAQEHTLAQALDYLKRELSAIRSYGERRGVMRRWIPQAVIELRDGQDEEEPMTGGVLRDLSASGIGLETEDEIPLPGPFRIRLSLPGVGEPIESTARVIWQQASGHPPRYQSGCELVDLPDTSRALIEQVIEKVPS